MFRSSSASAGASELTSCFAFSSRTADLRRGISGPKSLAGTRDSNDSLATCLMRWIASDFIAAVLDLFAYDRRSDEALVIGAGLPDAWLTGQGVRVDRLRTPYGPLSYSLRRDGRTTRLEVAAGMQIPPGGFVFAWPGDGPAAYYPNQRQSRELAR